MFQDPRDIKDPHSESIPVAFKDVLLDLRQQRGWSQQDLADQIGVHVQLIKRYELGGGVPSLETLGKIAEAFGVSTDLFVFDHGTVEGKVLDDAELLELFREVKHLRAQEREAVRVLLRALIHRGDKNDAKHPRSSGRSRLQVVEHKPASKAR